LVALKSHSKSTVAFHKGKMARNEEGLKNKKSRSSGTAFHYSSKYINARHGDQQQEQRL
jgi:hypothetical protein